VGAPTELFHQVSLVGIEDAHACASLGGCGQKVAVIRKCKRSHLFIFCTGEVFDSVVVDFGVRVAWVGDDDEVDVTRGGLVWDGDPQVRLFVVVN